MDNDNLAGKLQQEMQEMDCHAKAEVQMALALEKGLGQEDFMVCCDSFFYRSYSRDIKYTELKENGQKRTLLELHLSRRGLYDELPQGLFHQPGYLQKHTHAAAGMAKLPGTQVNSCCNIYQAMVAGGSVVKVQT